jgi:hypothetical protein
MSDAGLIVSGTYLTTDFESGDVFPAPAPAANTTSLTNFHGTSPNGLWSLYAVDDASLDSGVISGGWSLNIGMNISRPVLSSPTMHGGGQFQFILEGAQGVAHVIEASTNLINWVPVKTNVVNGPTPILMDPEIGTAYKFFRARAQ